MNSYNKINGAHGSENKHTQIEILRDEWGFDGVVVSDYRSIQRLCGDILATADDITDAAVKTTGKAGGLRL